MDISDKTHTRLRTLSTIGMAAGLAGALYFGGNSSVEKDVQKLNKENAEMTTELVNCVPRDRKTSISDFCINYARRHDSLEREIKEAENTPEYISAQRDKLYSYGFGFLMFFSFVGSIYLYEKEKSKENRTQVPMDDQ